jgi:hypothetical protein
VFNATDVQTNYLNKKYTRTFSNIKEAPYNDNGEKKTEPKEVGNLEEPTWVLNSQPGHTDGRDMQQN